VEIVGRLRARPLTVSPEGKLHPHCIPFSPEAKALWVRWYDEQVDESNGPAYDADELSVDGKLSDFAARLALILHMLNEACDPTRGESDPIPPLSLWAVSGAIKLWAYFRSHHRRARWFYNGGIGNAGARAIIEWARRNGHENFDERELKRNLTRFQNDPVGMAESLNWLAERHALRLAPQPDRPEGRRGRKPSPVWLVHPMIRATRV
jgi:hypothetical protein